METEARIRREQDFHDRRFSQGGARGNTGVFYRICRDSDAAYHRRIREDTDGKRVLEYGCGRGSQGFALAANGARVTGIDISPAAIEIAREIATERRLTGTEFVVMNAEEMTFPDASFDRVIGSGILHHLDLNRAFGEIARVLTPGGRAIFVEPLGHNPLINLYRRATPSARTEDEHPLLMRDFALARNYFGRVDVTYYHLATLAAVPFSKTPLFGPILSAFSALDRALLSDRLPLQRYAWQTLIEFSAPLQKPALVTA